MALQPGTRGDALSRQEEVVGGGWGQEEEEEVNSFLSSLELKIRILAKI
jgi:hypothetical protein